MSALREIGKLRMILVAEDYRQFAVLFTCMLLAAGLQVIGVASILPFMQLLAEPGTIERSEWMRWLYGVGGFGTEREMLIWSGCIVFVLFTISVIATALTSWLIQRSIWATAHRLCVRQLRIYMQLPYEFFLANSSTELLRRIVADVNKLLTDVLLAGSLFLSQAVLAIGLFVLLLLVNPTLSAIAFLGFGSAYFGLHLLRHAYLVKLGRERIETDHRRYTTFIDAISGMKAIRVANAARYFLTRFSAASQDYARIYPRLDLVTNVPRHAMEVLSFGGILLVVLVVILLEGEFVRAVPTLSVFALATYRLMPAMHTLFDGAAKLSNSLPVIASIAEDMRTDRVLEPIPQPQCEPLPFEREIRLQEASFRYASAKGAAICDLDLRLKKGESVAFVGATGSGKTTLVDIVVGLLLPTSGSLRVDDVTVTPTNAARWRQIIAYVPQDVFLYDDTIAANIEFGIEEQARNEDCLRAAARAACIDAFITGELAHGYGTMVGERGVRLSGGQRQRLGIARALYRQPRILVLDEATSALDSITEESVMSNLHHAFPDITIVMVAHRLSTVKLCDRILLCSDGRIADEGPYEQLYESNMTFRQMVDASGGAA